MPVHQELNEEQLARVYTALWQNISREDANVSSRIGWAIGLTAGQFTAISFMVVRIGEGPKTSDWPILIALTITAIAILGMFFCYRTKLGVEAAHAQISYLQDEYRVYQENFRRMGLPRPFGEGKSNQPGRKSSHVFPVALLSFWTMVFVAAICGSVVAIAIAAASSIR